MEGIEEIIETFMCNTEKPELYLSHQNQVAASFKQSTKEIYDITKEGESEHRKIEDVLPELIIEDFDDEQVWQELELQNKPVLSNLITSISELSTTSALSLLKKKEGHSTLKQIKKRRLKKSDIQVEELIDNDSEQDGSEMDSEIMDERGIGGEQEVNSDMESDTSDVLGLKKGHDNDSYNSDDSAEEKFLKELLKKAEAEDYDNESEDIDEQETDMGIDSEKEFELEDSENGDKSTSFSGKVKAKKKKLNKSDLSSPFNLVAKRSKNKSEVDDRFFRLADMESFLDREDMREERKNDRTKESKTSKEEDSDSDEDMETEELEMLYEDLPSSESEDTVPSGRNIKYADFFGEEPENWEEDDQNESGANKREIGEEDEEASSPDDADTSKEKKRKKNVNLFSQSDSESDGDNLTGVTDAPKSAFEKQQNRVKERITDMEEAALSEKPWQLMGEVGGTVRPVNSLLEDDLEFEQQTKTAPVITEETTKTLEDIIKQRIKDKAFDDVQRKEKVKEEAFEYKKRITLDQEKSKMSLGDIYEQEYIKQTQEEEDEKEDPKWGEIKKMMQSLFTKLDALSNFHYTPKQAQPETKIISNLPSVTMEEVQPLALSEAALLAPEEIKVKGSGELKGDTEKSKADRIKARKEKKKRQKMKHKAKEKKMKLMEKIAPSLAQKSTKEKLLKELKTHSKAEKGISLIKDKKSSKNQSLTSSSHFFTRLQEEVTVGIQNKKTVKKVKQKKSQTGTSLKL